MAKQTGPTLTDVTQLGRQAVKVVILFFVVLIVGRFALQSFVAFWKAMNPPPPPPPTVGFGLLPQIRFPEKPETEVPTKYTLELPRGVFPEFPDRAKVFFIPQTTLTLFSDQNARAVAAKYGFVFEPTILSTRLYRWQKSAPLQSTLQMDIQSFQIRFTTEYLNRPDLLLGSRVPELAQAEQLVKSFMRTGGIGDQTILNATSQSEYLKLEGTKLVEAVSYSDADFVRVRLNRTPIDDAFEMYTPDTTGIVEAIVAGGTNTSAVVDFTSNFRSIDSEQLHTYPLRTPAQAWGILQAGEGYVASHTGTSTAVIRRVMLGYYDDFEEQQYLQPIYVFLGDDDFVGYVPAIDPRYIQSNQTK